MVTESFIKLFKKHRCLFDPTDPSHRHRRARTKAHEQLLKELNEISSHQLDMQNLKTMIKNYQHQLRRKKIGNKTNVNESFTKLFKKHRCLFDPTDPSYGQRRARSKSHEDLLIELNEISSHQLDMQDLKNMIKNYQHRTQRKKVGNKSNNMPKAEDVKSQPSSEPTSTTGESPLHGVSTPKTDTKSDLEVVSKVNAPSDEIFKKHSCLLDTTQPCSKILECKGNCQDDLLKEMNQISSQQYTIEDLKQMIRNYQQKLQHEKRKRKMENLPKIQIIISLPSIESTTDTGVGTPHTDAVSDRVVVKEEVDSSAFDVVVKYEETSDEDGES